MAIIIGLSKDTLRTKYCMDRINLWRTGKCYSSHHSECKGANGKCECECHHG